MLELVDPQSSLARIKVFGVGGGGSNAVNRMIQAGLNGVEFWVANTDLQALEQSACPNRLPIGKAVTRGLGAGGDPEIGRMAGEEDREAIKEVLLGTDMLFITAGMGGGTGTGAAPVVAETAKELGILTVAIVTKPFSFEGKKKMARAVSGLEELGRSVDTLIAIPNQKLLNIVTPGTPFRAAMLVADEVLFQATRGISDLITGHGDINLDFADVKTVMKNRGNALLGCGVASGKDRAVEAAQAAVSSPLLEEVSILGAEALLINVQGGPNMTLHEAAEAAQFISERVGEETDVFWGSVVDPNLDEEIRVTLIATGFPGSRATTVSSEAAARPQAAEILPVRPAPAEPVRSPEPRPMAPTAPAGAAPAGAPPSRPPEPARAPEREEEFEDAPLETICGARSYGAGEDLAGGLMGASWPSEPDSESGLFLNLDSPPAPPEKEKAGGHRGLWARATQPKEAPESPPWVARLSSPSVSTSLRDELPWERRLGRRHPLDEPAFMRKKMD
jgi:cell division protein FtsZ